MALTYLMLSALVAGAVAGPIFSTDSSRCAQTCPEGSAIFSPGKTYSYDYVSTITTSIPGTTDDESTLSMTATANIDVFAPCDMALRLTNVVLQDADPNQPGRLDNVERGWYFKQALQERTLRFGHSAGRVQDVCPHAEEHDWALNVKKAILSSLQISVPTTIDEPITLTETDVVGECEVTYTPLEGTWSTTKLSKSKDLLSCKSRMSADSIFQSIPYDVPSSIQSLPLLKSTHECEHELDSAGKLIKTSCDESHIFRPFSRGNSGATTRVNTELVFRQESDALNLAAEPVGDRTDMLFRHVVTEENQEVTKRDAILSLRALCDGSTDGITSGTPAQFATLVKQMKKLDTDTLVEVAERAPRMCDKAMKFFQDALPALGTTASLSVMRSLVLQGEVSGDEIDRWMTSITFISEPTAQMLEQVKPLLAVAEPRPRALLAVGSMVHAYCRTESHCADHPEVTAIMELLEPMLNGNCGGDHDRVLVALKAIGNTGVAHGVVPTLGRCLLNEQAPVELRVAAVNAFRRMGCSANMEDVRALFLNTQADSELRINAYLMLMECPSYSILNDVYAMLESEQVNQVGSFIWTHLTNLLETRSPIKQDIRNILDNSQLKQAFDLDKRKFSRNIEWSGFSDALNTGATVDSNLIWSSKSFLPRSATVNLTVDLFGQSVNLMEIGGRVEGMDSILEKFFTNEEDNSIPNRRSAVNPSYIDTMDQNFRAPEVDPKGSYFLRVFGNEMTYDDLHGLDLNTIKDKFNYLQWIVDLATEQEYEMTKSIVLLDADITVPTACGLPLKLSVDGSAVLDLKLKGKADIRNLFSSGNRGVDITGIVRPSAGLQVEASMGVDAWVTSTGLKMTNTFHTSTMADGSLQLRDGKIFNMDINMPDEQMEIFKAESKFFVKYRDSDREQAMSRGSGLELTRCLGGTLESALGLELCGDLSLPALTTDNGPWYPLTGPASLSMVLNKRDTFTQYHLGARMIADQVSTGVTNYGAELSFNTPGSTIDRELSLNFDLNQSEKSMRLDLRSPWKKVDFSANVEMTEELRRLNGRAVLDESEEYALTAELQLAETPYRKKYDTSVTISLPRRDQIALTGAVQYRSGKLIDVDFAVKNVLDKPIKIKGALKKAGRGDQATYTSEVSVKVAQFKGQFDGSLDIEKQNDQFTCSSQAELKYKIGSGRQEQFSFNHHAQLTNQRDNKQASLSWAMANSIEPNYDTDMTMMVSKDTSAMAAQFQLGLTNVKPKRITFDTRAAYIIDVNDLSSAELDTTLNLALPWKDISYEAVVKHKHSDSELSFLGDVKYDGDNSAQFDLSLKKESMAPLMLSARVGVKYPGRDLLYEHSLQERTPDVFHHDLTITLDAYEQVRLISTYTKANVHQFVAELSNPFSETIQIEMELKPRLNDFDTKARVQCGSEEYSTAANWRFQNARSAATATAMFEVAYPQRKVVVDASLSRRGDSVAASLETKYDATRDMSKKVVGRFEMDMSATQPTITARTEWYPNKFIEVTGNLKKESQGWFQVTSDIEGALHITSSCPDYGNVQFAFSHERSPTAFTAHVETSWSASRRMDFDLNLNRANGWGNTQATMMLNTPFETLRRLKIESGHTFESGAANTNSKVQWNNEEITLVIGGTFESSSNLHSGNIRFTSPFEGYEDIILTGTHRFVSGELSTHASASLGTSRTYSIDLTMSHDRNGWYITNNGELNINMPFRTKFVWNHNNNQYEMSTRAELELGEDHSVFDLYGKLRRKSQFTASLNTPYFPRMAFGASHETERRTWKNIKSSLEMSYGGTDIKLENDMSFEMYKQISMSTKFISPFRNFEQLSIEIDNKEDGQTYTAKNEIKWASDKMITLGGTYTLSGEWLFDGEIIFTSPFTEDFSLTGSHGMLEEMHVVTGNMNYGRTQLTEGTIKFTPRQLISLDFNGAHDDLRDIKFVLRLNGEPTNGVYTCEINHFKLSSPMKAELRANVNYVNPSFNLNIETPFREVRFIRSTFTHTYRTGNSQTHFTLEIPQRTITIHSGNQVRSYTDFTSNSYIEYESGKRIEVDASLNGLTGSAKITTPFQECELAEVSLEHTSHRSQVNNKLSLKYNANAITIESQISTGSSQNMRLTVNSNLEWPHDIDLTLSHAGSLTDFQNSATLTINGDRYTTSNTFALRDNNLEIDFNVNDMFVLTFSSTGLTRNHRNSGTVMLYGKQYSTANSFIFGDNRLELDFNINDMYKLTLIHTGPINDFENSGTLEFDGQRYTASSKFSLHGNNLAMEANINDMYELTFSSSGSATNNHNSGRVTMLGQHYTTANSFVFGDNRINLNIDINDMYKLTFTHSGPINDFENSGSLEFDGQRYTASSKFSLHGHDLSMEININDMFDLTFSSAGSVTDTHNSGRVTLYGEQYTTANSLVFADNRLEMNIDVNNLFKFSVSHNGPINNFENSGSLEFDGQRYAASSKFSLSGNDLTMEININDMFDLTFSSAGSVTNTRNSGRVTLYGQRYTTANSFVFADNRLEMNIDVNNMFKLSVSHNGPINNFENSGSLEFDGQRYTASSKFSLNGNDLTMEININDMFDLTFSSAGALTNTRNSGRVTLYGQRYRTANSFMFADNRLEMDIDINDMYKLTLSHTGPINNFENSGTLEFDGQRYTASSKFSLHGNNLAMEANINDMYELTFSSSGSATNNHNSGRVTMLGQHYTTANSFVFGDNRLNLNIDINDMYKLTFTHSGPINDFQNSGSLEFNGERYTMSNAFALRENNLELSINLNELYRLTVSHSGTLTDFENSLVIPGRNPFRFTTSFKLDGNNVESAVTARTPYAGYTDMAIRLAHTGEWNNMNTALRANIEDRNAGIETLFKYRDNYIEGEIKLMTPFEECESVTFGMKHTGTIMNFNNELTFELNGETSTTTTIFQLLSNRLDLTFTGRSPSDEAALRVQHTGSMTNFENDLTITFNDKQIKAGSEFKILRNKVEMEMKLQTPFREVRNFVVSMTHTGSARDFSNVISGTLNRDVITANTGFKLRHSGLDASFELTTPFRDLSAFGINIEHNGPVTDFSNIVTITYNDGTMTNNVDFTWGDEKHGSIRVSTPFEAMRSMNIGFVHSGRWMSDMSTEVTTTIDGRSVGLNVLFKFEDGNLDSSITFTSPQVSFAAAARHNGDMDNFHNVLSASLNGDSISKTTMFRMVENNIEGSIRIETPFDGMSDMGMSFKHSGPINNCESEFRANLGNRQIEADFDFKKLAQEFEISAKIETPIEAIRQVGFTVKHEGHLSNFQQEASIQYNTYQGAVKSMFKWEDEIEARIELETPWSQVRQAEASFTHGGRLSNFNTNAMLKINDETYISTAEFLIARSRVHIVGRINLPEEYSFELEHTGPHNDFSNTLLIKFADRSITENTIFKLDGTNIDASWELNTPFTSMENTQVVFTHQGALDNFRQQSRIGYNGKSITHKVEFTYQRRQISGKLEMTTPCPYFETFSVEASHQGRWSNFENGITIQLNGEEYKGNSEFKVYAKKMMGEASIKIPQQYNVRFVHKGEMTDFTNTITANLDGDNIQVISAFKKTDTVVEGSAQVRTPYTGYDEFSTEFSFRNKRRMKISGMVQTPFESFRRMNFEMKHEGNLRAFSTEGKLELPLESLPEVIFDVSHTWTRRSFSEQMNIRYGEKLIAASATYSDTNEKREVSMSLESPCRFVQQIGFTYSANKSPVTHAFDASWNGRRIDGNLSFKTDPNVELAATLRTPWRILRELNINTNHHGTLTNFAASSTITLNGESVNGNVDFRKDGDAIETSGTINLPIANYDRFGFSISHNGNPSNLRSSADFNTPAGDFGVDFTYEGVLTNFRSTGTLRTPYEVLPSITARLNHQGTLEDFSCSGEVEYKSQKVEGQLTFKKEDNKIATNLVLSTPFEMMESLRISTEHRPESESLAGQIDLSYNGVQYVDVDYTLGTGSSPSASLNMRSPRRMQSTGRYSRNAQSTSAQGTFNWDGQEYSFGLENAKELDISLGLPDRTLRLTTSWEMTEEKFAHQTTFQWEDSEDKKVSYEVEVTRSNRGRQNIYDGHVVLTNKYGSLRTTFNHQVNPGRRYASVVTIQNLTLRQNLVITRPREMKLTLTAQHPTFQRDVVIDIEGVIEPETPRIDGKITAEYADQSFEFSVKFADESSSGNDRRYIAEAHLTHPASALDVQFTSALTNNMESMGGNFDVSYMMARDRQVKNAALRAQINKIREELNMEVSTPLKRVSMTGRRTLSDESEGRQQFTVTGNVDDRNIEALLDLDRLSPSIDMKLTYNPDEMLHVYGKYLDPSTIKFEAYHERDGGRVQDSELSLRLSNKNTLNGRAYARASILDDLRAAWEVESEVGAALQRVKNTFLAEVEARSSVFQNAVAPIHSTMTEFGSYVGNWYNTMRDANDFFVQDITFVVGMAVSGLAEGAYQGWMVIVDNAQVLQARMNEFLQMCTTHWDNTLQMIRDTRAMVCTRIEATKASVYQYAMEQYEYVRQHPYMDTIKEKLTPMVELFKERLEILRAKYYDVVDEVQRLYGDIMAEPAMQYVKEYTDAIIEYVASVGEYVEFSEEAKAWFAQMKEMGLSEIRERAINWAHDQISLFKFEITTWEPSQSLVEVMVRVPIELQDLRSLPDLHIAEKIEQLTELVQTCTPTIRTPTYSFWDTFYAYKPTTEVSNWIPPFEGHAFLSGNSNYMTFDKHFYSFAGDCSYLLARDFIDGRFSIIVNYNNGIKQSLSVISDDTQIEIKPDFSVTVSGSQMELPIVTSAATVRRIGNTVRIDRTQGLTVTCDLINDHCTFNVSGWYYGKTGGLLGTYDNEPSNDMTTSTHTLAENVGDFAQSWSSGGRCSYNYNAQPAILEESSTRYQACARFFEDNSSPMRACFRQVDTPAFMTMCINEVSASSNVDDTVCKVASAYREECSRVNVPLDMPSQCVRCEMNDGRSMINGEELTLTTTSKTSDIVFVVSHSTCNQEVIERLFDLVERLDNNLNAEGYTNNRFGLVGYAGRGLLRHPHSHTFEGRLMTASREFNMNNFDLIESSSEDVLGAVEFASKYQFRAGASKSIIVIPCDTCREMSTSYSTILTRLTYQNIRLHTLAKHSFTLQSDSPKTSFIFGVDSRSLYTTKDVRDDQLTGDLELRRQVNMPRDLCSSLGEVSHGSFFNVDQLLHSRTNVQKKFADVFTRLVAKKLSTSECQSCQCVPDAYTGVGQTVCRSCEAENAFVPWIGPEVAEQATAVRTDRQPRPRGGRRGGRRGNRRSRARANQ